MQDLWRALLNTHEMKWSRFAAIGALVVLISGITRGSVVQGAVGALSFVALAIVTEGVGRRFFAPQAKPVVATEDEDIVAARGAVGVNAQIRVGSDSQTSPSSDASAGSRPDVEGNADTETRKRACRRGGADLA